MRLFILKNARNPLKKFNALEDLSAMAQKPHEERKDFLFNRVGGFLKNGVDIVLKQTQNSTSWKIVLQLLRKYLWE